MTVVQIGEETVKFLTLYAKETGKEADWLDQRLGEVANETSYVPTTDELTFGARVAWRNSNKCIGRLFWQSLEVFDQRHLEQEELIYEALLQHIRFATNDGKIRPAITVFAPNRVRIWNHQLLRYAGYETEQGIVGDPHSVDFTNECIKLGWQPKYGRFDILPFIIQVGERKPMLFEIPSEDILEVQMEHPTYEAFSQLGLKWYAVPIISDMKFECGSITFEGAPFNGWYMGTEIGARNFADETRYNMLAEVADVIGIPRNHNISLWKDRALVELNIAVLHSFKKAGVSIVDHHTAAQQFLLFQQREQEQGREATGNWTWLIPPLSPATTHIFHAPIQNTIQHPNYFYQKKPY